MKINKEGTINITISLDKTIYNKVDGVAELKGIKKSTLINYILKCVLLDDYTFLSKQAEELAQRLRFVNQMKRKVEEQNQKENKESADETFERLGIKPNENL